MRTTTTHASVLRRLIADGWDIARADEEAERIAAEDARVDLVLERRRQAPPAPWGHRLDSDAYFCHACWRDGGDGRHPDNVPPCDPI